MKVSVLTIAYRPGYVDSLTSALKAQSFSGFEWVLVDELVELRKDLVEKEVAGAFPVIHVAPKVISEYSATGAAMNTGIARCRGELVHFMADYMHIHPRTLERHWEIYRRHGPKVLISGALIDRLVAAGYSVPSGAGPVNHTVKVGDMVVTYPEWSPPIEWPLKRNYWDATPENLLSIFERPFTPLWAESVPPDWRTSQTASVQLEEDLYENRAGYSWWYAGRSDSAPLQALLAAGGMDETPGQHGGLEVQLCRRMMEWGCRHLIDTRCPSYMLPHPYRKKETGWEMKV